MPKTAQPTCRAPETAGLARIDVFDSMAAAEPFWRRIETASDSILTPYQRFDLLAPWQRHIGSRNGITPLIAVGFDRHEEVPVCLWPLGVHSKGATRIATFLGGKHANFNSMIWRRDIATGAPTGLIDQMMGRLTVDADALILLNQPQSWNGVANPMMLLPHSVSTDPAYRGALMPDIDALLQARMSASKRKKLRNRERALAHYGDVVFRRAMTREDVRAVLAAFHEQKAQRMQELGVSNVFAEPGVADFIAEAACTGLEHGPAIELYVLSAGGQIVATSAGIVAGGRFSTMFNSIIRNELAQASPGQLLLTRLVQSACERGLHTFDLGVGEAQYKEIFCNDPEPLFDSFLPLSTAGRMMAAVIRATYAAKRTVKRTPALWSVIQKARRWRGHIATH